jgi:hypothetical protein
MESMIFVFKNQKPQDFISKVSLDGKQIFPKKESSESIASVPQAVFIQNKFECTSDSTGKYTFTTNKNEVINKKLNQPKIYEITDFKGSIRFSPIYADSIQPVAITELKSLTEFENPAIKYFAGKAKYTVTFDVPADFVNKNNEVTLNLGKIDATSEVWLNGKFLAYTWLPNSNIPVTNLLKKNNVLEVTAATVCRNRFIGDYIQFGSIKTLWTTAPMEELLNKNMPLKPTGWMGPVSLSSYTK